VRKIPRGAVIATHNRPAELRRCVEAIAPQVDLVVVVDNASDPPIMADILGGPSEHLAIGRDEEQPPNLSRLWNSGLAGVRLWLWDRPGVEQFEGHTITMDRWDVAVLNDDAVPPPGWFDAVAGAMRNLGCDAASSDPFDMLPPGHTFVYRASAPMGVTTRLAGWAMMLRGEWGGAYFDERLRWWFGDDELSLRAREAGGLVHVGGFPVPNTLADTSTTGVLAEQAGRDRATFVEITGRQPW